MKYIDDKREDLLSIVFWNYTLDIKEIIKTITKRTSTRCKMGF